jgi:hypothetical protein
MMLYRLQSVGLSEEEFENYIRREPADLFNNVESEKLQALATVINKKDFMHNYDLTEQQYNQIDQRFDITGKKVIMNQQVAQMTGAGATGGFNGDAKMAVSNVQAAPVNGQQQFNSEPVNVNFAPMGREGDVNVQTGGTSNLPPTNNNNVITAPTNTNLGTSFAPVAPMQPDNPQGGLVGNQQSQLP